MFVRRRLRNELGDLVAVHRPFNPLIAWGLLVAISSPFAILFALGPPGPLVGLALFFGFLVPFSYMFGEWILLQHRIYRHGVVFRSIAGLRTYVVPFSTVRPEEIEVVGRYRVPRGEFRLAQREHRECPVVETSVRLVGLRPRHARRLAKGRLSWRDASAEAAAYDGTAAWQASFRNPEHYCRLLRETALASDREHPHGQA